jgi:hypothetical protein
MKRVLQQLDMVLNRGLGDYSQEAEGRTFVNKRFYPYSVASGLSLGLLIC